MTILRNPNGRSLLLSIVGATTVFFAGCSGSTPTGTSTIPTLSRPTSATSATTLSAGAIESAPTSFTFTTLDDQSDPAFNQLLGINDKNVISGYFGSGVPGHPNKGYLLNPPYGQGNYVNENFPGSVQTQVTAIDGKGNTAGFWVDNKNVNRGFIEWNGVFTSYQNPHTDKGTVNQILGLNNSGIAVGFFTDGRGINHAFTLNQATGVYHSVIPPGAKNVTASAINNNGDIVGFYTINGVTTGFLDKSGSFSTFEFPGGSTTEPFGINIHDQIVGSYLDGAGVLHGFLLKTPLTHATWQSIDDPNGVGSTVVNGLNDNDDLVGFYTDAAGNTDGMLANP